MAEPGHEEQTGGGRLGGALARCEDLFARRPALRAAAVVALYALFFTLFFSPVLFAGRLLAPGDGVNFHAPFFYARPALWTPLLWGGYPLAADPQAMAWYPLAALLALFPRSYNAFVVAAYVVAAAGAHGYARSLTRSGLAGAVCGLAYSLSGFMLAQQGHLSMVHSAAWAPLVFWSLEELRRAPRSRWLLAAAASVAACGLAGHFQVFLYTLGLAGLYCLFTGWAPALGRRARFALLLSAVALGLALTGVQLVPTAELTAHGQRARMEFAEFNSFSLPPRHLARLFFPYALGGSPGSFYGVPYFGRWGPPVGGWGPTELAVYVGLLPLALAFVGLTAERRNRVAWFWAGAGVLALLLALGDATPLAHVVFRLPGYNNFRAAGRHLFELALAVSVLAAYGAAALRRARARPRAALYAAAAIACATLAALLALAASAERLRATAAAKGIAGLAFAPWRNPATGVPLAVLAASCAALLIWSRRPGSPARQSLLLLVLVCDLASFGWFYEWRYTAPAASALAPPAATERHSEAARASGQRVLPATGALTPREGFPPNVSVLWGAPSASGYSALILARVSRLLEMSNDGAVSARWADAPDRALDLFAVRYVFTPRTRRDAAAGSGPPATGDGSAGLTTERGGVGWDSADLGVVLGAGCNATRRAAEFELPAPARADSVAVVSTLACSAAVADETPLARLTLTDAHGGTHALDLRAGRDASEWAYDCPDVRPQMAHRRATVFQSHPVERGGARCDAHTYSTALRLDGPVDVTRVRLEWIGGAGAIDVRKISLVESRDIAAPRSRPVLAAHVAPDPARWRRAAGTDQIEVYENLRARPRVWLAAETVTLDADAVLRAIKTGRLPDGTEFNPASTALVEEPAPLARPAPPHGTPPPAPGALPPTPGAVPPTRGEAVVRHDSGTRLGLRVRSEGDAFLVLSDVNFPGWRATVDGQEARVFQTDYVLRGVHVPAGEHVVEFTYAPRSLYAGAALSALALAALALLALRLRRRGDAV